MDTEKKCAEEQCETARKVAAIGKAFSLTADGDRDYPGHRHYHDSRVKYGEKWEKRWESVVTWAIIGALGFCVVFARESIKNNLIAIVSGVG